MSCKTDCYWYHEDQDMNAIIPECKARKLYPLDERDCEKCNKYHSKLKQTNADRIRSMTDEELADFLVNTMTCTACRDMHGRKCPKTGDYKEKKCGDMILYWLKKEAEE